MKFLKVLAITVFLLMPICDSANAILFTCIDNKGAKIFRDHSCMANEYQRDMQQSYQISVETIYKSEVAQPSVYSGGVTSGSAVSAECEKRGKELKNSKVKITNMGGAMAKLRLEQDYWIDCVLPPEQRAAAIEKRDRKRAEAQINQKLDDIQRKQNTLHDTTEGMRNELHGGMRSPSYLWY